MINSGPPQARTNRRRLGRSLRSKPGVVLSLGLALALGTAACGSASIETETVETVEIGGSSGESAAGVADISPVTSATFDTADYAGQDVLFWFWAPW